MKKNKIKSVMSRLFKKREKYIAVGVTAILKKELEAMQE
jgi:hypothetical protein